MPAVRSRPPASVLAALAVLSLVAGGAMVGAALRTSTTFDEIVLVSAGARAVGTGSRSLAVDQPPLMPLLYGLPVAASGARLPPEEGESWEFGNRWRYARTFYWGAGNDPRRLALMSRSVGILLALALGLVTWAFTRRAAPEPDREGAALLAAGLTLLMPDVLAHGAVAYNDVPIALAFFVAVWALDAWARRPDAARSVLAGTLCALALGVKFSAVALVPVAALVVAAEAVARRGDRAWGRRLAGGTALAVVVAYAVTVLLYGGDLTLRGLRLGFWMTVRHATEGHPAPAFLLGRTSPEGWWWFYPATFFLKTPAALHLLMLVAAVVAVGAWRRWRAGGGRGPETGAWTALLGSPLRAPVVGLAVFVAFVLRARLAAGFRYALPALPFVTVLTAVGVAVLWRRTRSSRVRLAVVLLCLLYAGSSLGAYPWFLSYTSEWVGGKDRAWRVLADSSVDWGQGLLELDRWMEEEGVPAVRLSYFGSAPPAGYGIRYQGLPSFFPLLPASTASPGEAARWTVVSVTNAHGLYFEGEDPFAEYRERIPERVLAGSLLVFREDGNGSGARSAR